MNKQYISEAFDTLHDMQNRNKNKTKKVIKESSSNEVRLYIEYVEFGSGGFGGTTDYKKGTSSGDNEFDALKKIMYRLFAVDDLEIEEEGYTFEDFLEIIKRYNDDGDYVITTLLKNLDTGEVYIEDKFTPDEEEENFDESLSKAREIIRLLNEASMTDEERRDNELLRSIVSKQERAKVYGSGFNFTPEEKAVAKKYNLTLPSRVGTARRIIGLRDNEDPEPEEDERLRDGKTPTEAGAGSDLFFTNLDYDLPKKPYYYSGAPADSSVHRTETDKDFNYIDFIRKRRERGRRKHRDYARTSPYKKLYSSEIKNAHDVDDFGDTTFIHDQTGRFSQGDDPRRSKGEFIFGDGDLSDVEKDRIRINKEMSKPVRDMKKALKARKEAEADLAKAHPEYTKAIADADAQYARSTQAARSAWDTAITKGQRRLKDTESEIDRLLKRGKQ